MQQSRSFLARLRETQEHHGAKLDLSGLAKMMQGLRDKKVRVDASQPAAEGQELPVGAPLDVSLAVVVV